MSEKVCTFAEQKQKWCENPTNSAQIWKILTQQKLSKTLTLIINFKSNYNGKISNQEVQEQQQ